MSRSLNSLDMDRILSDPSNSDPRFWLPLMNEFRDIRIVLSVMDLVQQCRLERLVFSGFLSLLNPLANLRDDKSRPIPCTVMFADRVTYSTVLPSVIARLPRPINVSEQRSFPNVRALALAVDGVPVVLPVDLSGVLVDVRRLETNREPRQRCFAIQKCEVFHQLTSEIECLLFSFQGDGRVYLFYGGHQHLQKDNIRGWRLRSTGMLEQKLKQLCRVRSLSFELMSRLICVSLELADLGIGAALMFGDVDTLVKFSHPLNPNLLIDALSVDLLTTSPRELCSYAVPDGAILIDESGHLRFIGMKLDAPVASSVKMGSHTGTRHEAVANATASSKAIGVVISADDGQLSVFVDGSLYLEW